MCGRGPCLILVSTLTGTETPAVYWHLAADPPGEEKLSDVSAQQLRIKNSLRHWELCFTRCRRQGPRRFAEGRRQNGCHGADAARHGWVTRVRVCVSARSHTRA